MDSIYNNYVGANQGALYQAETSSGSFESEFTRDRKRLLQEPVRIEPKVRNVIIPRIDIKADDEAYCHSAKPLRVSVEIYPDNECIAYLLAEKSISGYGSSIAEATKNMVSMLLEDFLFYVNTDDSNLTQDAIELKAKLSSLFEMEAGRH
jgi:hypothetical protein